MKLLIVEDDELIGQNLKTILERETYAVSWVRSVEDAIEKLVGEEYDLAICDRRLPDGDGLDIVKVIRSSQVSTPILMLTARNKQREMVEGLDSGADDYIGKPFEKVELLARVRSLLRRRKKIILKPSIMIRNVNIDFNKREVSVTGRVVQLSPKEYALLEYLILNPGKALDRVDILTHVWDEEVDLFSNTVDVHVRYLRQKLGNWLIKTVRGKGYMIWQK